MIVAKKQAAATNPAVARSEFGIRIKLVTFRGHQREGIIGLRSDPGKQIRRRQKQARLEGKQLEQEWHMA